MDDLSVIDADRLNLILEEISGYEIQLVEDPTLPEYGNKYLQSCISKCRTYLNRVNYYIMKCSSQEKLLKRQILILETDINIKMNGLIADDPVVRKQPSITDRMACASSMLSDENAELTKLKILIQDLSETIKIIKMKHRDLQAANSDIKTQRQIIRDEKFVGDGIPGRNQDGSLPEGMPPRANKPQINPADLLDPSKRPDDMPVPKDAAHARQIADFFNNAPAPSGENLKESVEDMKTVNNVTYEDLLS